MGKLVIFGNHIMVQVYMGDMRFDRCIMLAKISPDALDWPNFPREWGTPDFLLLAPMRQRCLCLAIRSGTTQRVLVPSCNSSTWSSSSNKQQKKQAAAASSSCKTSPAHMAHAGMAPCRRLTQAGFTSCSLLRISTTITPAAQPLLHGNDQGSTVTRTTVTRGRSGEGQELAAHSVLILQVLLLLLLLLRALLQSSVTHW